MHSTSDEDGFLFPVITQVLNQPFVKVGEQGICRQKMILVVFEEDFNFLLNGSF